MEKLSCLSIPNLPTCTTTITQCETRLKKLSKNKIIQILIAHFPHFSGDLEISVLKLFLFSFFSLFLVYLYILSSNEKSCSFQITYLCLLIFREWAQCFLILILGASPLLFGCKIPCTAVKMSIINEQTNRLQSLKRFALTAKKKDWICNPGTTDLLKATKQVQTRHFHFFPSYPSTIIECTIVWNFNQALKA